MTPYTAPYREIGLIGLAAAALYVLLAIASYSPLDPSFSFSGDGNHVRNWVGTSGAFLADVVLYLFGFVAYVLPAALVVVGVRLVRTRGAGPSWALFVVRFVGWVGMALCTCVLIQLHALSDPGLPAGSGGVLGQWLTQTGIPVFGVIGLTLLCVAGALTGVQAAMGFSWLDIVETTGRHLHRFSIAGVTFADRRIEAFSMRRTASANTTARVARRRRSLKTEQQRRAVRKTPEIQSVARLSPKGQQQKLFDLRAPGELPPMDLLDEKLPEDERGYSEDSLEAISRLLELKLKDFGVDAEVVSVLPGPVITRFEVQPAPGVKVQKISALVKDLARSLSVISVRVVEVIPGKSVVGIEIPNQHREIVRLKEIFTSDVYQNAKSPLSLALGKDIAGVPVVTDITRMPHLLIAGTTGSGKSVGVNAMLMSILYKATPEEVRLILVDPKMLELSIYEGIPHLLTPVVIDMKEAAHALNWCVAEMERRYRLMAALGVRHLASFNRQVRDALKKGKPISDPLWDVDRDETPPDLAPLPLIVVVIDEFADMMMIVGKKVEQLIARIAQKARAAGIHLVLATQRPSVDVITGLIKANIPARISFQVSSKVDSRTILDQGGAEQLLGHGDLLYLPPGTSMPTRIHGAFVSDEEVHRVVADWKLRGAPDYQEEVITGGADEPFLQIESNTGSAEQDDVLYDEAVEFVLDSRRASISSVQRKLRVGYNRAARMIESMEDAGIVSQMNSSGSREVLVPSRG
ncbi:MAG: DNA translocase FtsK 4TM domain-containing protein [Gammaproteobacteria bacterium]|nr:DNA translocase FtsK 4TM domain-containing protein [Gammaproteobacteria bacterium]